MKITHTMLAAALATTMAMAGPSFANQNQSQKQQARNQSSSQNVTMQDVRRQVQGQVLDFRTVRLQGQNEPHVLAKVRQQNGQTVVLNLGPVNNLQQRNVRLFKGMQMEAAGQPGRINSQPILIVDRFIGDGQFTMLIPMNDRERSAMQNQQRNQQRRQAQASQNQQRRQQQAQRSQNQRFQDRRAQQQRAQQQSQQGQAWGSLQRGAAQSEGVQPGQNTMVVGTLVDMRNVRLSGLSRAHNLVKLRTNTGRTVVIDLGTDTLKDLRLRKGERIAVSGTAGRINGKPVIFAREVADIATINRSGEQQNRQR